MSHSAVVAAFTDGEVVDTEYLHLADLRSGRALTSRSSVSLSTVIPAAAASRTPVLPASASPTRVNTARSSGL